MIILDEINVLQGNSVDIDWKLFVNSIVSKYFQNEDIIIFMEIGALDGADSVYFKEKYPNSSVYTIEGLKSNYDTYIKDLQGINGYNICIAGFDGNIKYHKKKINGIHGIYNRGDKYGKETQVVQCVTLDTFCRDNLIEHIDVMKIDVEGATYDVLNNSEMLKNIKLMHIETENYPFFEGQKLDHECEELLKNNNFICLCKTGYYPESNGMQFDSVWINTKYVA